MEDVRCPVCRTPAVAALSVCARCGAELADRSGGVRTLVLREGPPSGLERRRAEALLAHTGEGLDEPEVRRQLDALPAVFHVPGSDAIVARLAQDLGACGYAVELYDAPPEPLGTTEYLESLMARKVRLLPYAVTATAFVASALADAGWTAIAFIAAGWGWWAVDRRAYDRRVTLSSPLLARRLDLVPADVAQPMAALLRGDVSESLRAAIGAVLTEHAHLLRAVHRLAAEHPELTGPVREALAGLGRHAARLAEKAAAIEGEGDLRDAQQPERIARLRAIGGEEVERRLLEMDIAQEQREGRLEGLRRMHATLVVRLEAIADDLVSLRQRVLEAALRGGDALAAVDALLGDLRREIDVAADAVGEMDRLEERLSALR